MKISAGLSVIGAIVGEFIIGPEVNKEAWVYRLPCTSKFRNIVGYGVDTYSYWLRVCIFYDNTNYRLVSMRKWHEQK